MPQFTNSAVFLTFLKTHFNPSPPPKKKQKKTMNNAILCRNDLEL